MLGVLIKIPAIISIDIPLPTPLLDIWSPNHKSKHVPAVNIKDTLKYSKAVAPLPKNENDITRPCKNASNIPKYLVILFNLTLPECPSLAKLEK